MEIAAEKLIIALDDLSDVEALKLVHETSQFAKTFKIGLGMFCAYGPKVIGQIKELGVEVFLDLKLHDIPMQVGKALQSIIQFKPQYITLHALGGAKMLKHAHSTLLGTNIVPLAVSLLTSHDEEEAQSLGFSSLAAQVNRLLGLAKESGISSFVASAHEASMLKKELGSSTRVICPGIRLERLANCDQARVMSAYDAILAGADALVVGRPVTKSNDPKAAAALFHDEIDRALKNK